MSADMSGDCKIPPIVVWSVLATVILFGIVLRSIHLTDVWSRSPDEKIYTYYAMQIAADGPRAFPRILREYVENETLWNYPSPTRITTLSLDALTANIAGLQDERAGVFVSWISSCLSLLLLAWIAARFVNPWVAILAAIFMAGSLTELALARRAWQDATVGLLSLSLFYVACEIEVNKQGVALWAAFCLLGVALAITKPTGFIVCAVLGCALFIVAIRTESSRVIVYVLILSLLSLALFLTISVAAAGGDPSLAIAAYLRSFSLGKEGLAYMAQVAFTPWYNFFWIMFLINPLTFILAALASILALFSFFRDLRVVPESTQKVLRLSFVLACSILTFVAFVPGLQTLRYISPATGAYYLLAAVGAYCISAFMFRFAGAKLVYGAAVCFFVLAASSSLSEYGKFKKTVVAAGLNDLAASQLVFY